MQRCLFSPQHLVSQHSHLDPFLNQVAHARVWRALWSPELAEIEEAKLGAERDEVGKETVEVALAAEMHERGKLGVVDVGVDAQQLLVDVLGGGGERRGKLAC